MKRRSLHSLFACLCVSALASCGSQRALHFAQRTTLDTSANTIQVGDKPIFKDSFGDIAIVYVLQGRDSKAPFSQTSAWRPADISAMISTAYYIKKEFDPKSHAVATGRYVK